MLRMRLRVESEGSARPREVLQALNIEQFRVRRIFSNPNTRGGGVKRRRLMQETEGRHARTTCHSQRFAGLATSRLQQANCITDQFSLAITAHNQKAKP